MNSSTQKKIIVAIILQVIILINGCSSLNNNKEPAEDLGATIGSLVEVISPESILVEGYGLVGGLNGTGSSQCPPTIRTYLARYIMAQLTDQTISTAESLIDSPDTAVVFVEGIIPVEKAQSRYFDLRVTALPGTQTTSLDYGWLYLAELKLPGSFDLKTEVLADAEGPVFLNKIDTISIDKQTGYVLAGGKSLTEHKIILVLHEADFKLTNSIRNRLNERFGPNVARAALPGQIEITVPARYREQRQRFILLIKSIYLTETPEINIKRAQFYGKQLAESQNKEESEIALEAIGNDSIVELTGLLSTSNEEVRLRAARCMFYLGVDEALLTLRQITLNESSLYRIEALESIATAAARSDTIAISQRLLRDEDFNVMLAAYEQLRKLDDISVAGKIISSNFYLEQITQTKQRIIYTSRSGQPKIILFGAPMYCRDNIFIESADGQITINAPTGQKYVSIIRKHPKRPDMIAQLRSSFELGDIIRTLCAQPVTENQQTFGGLGVTYADMIALLKLMCDKGAIDAQFRVGPLPEIGLNVKK